MTVKELRQKGFKVRVRHNRKVKPLNKISAQCYAIDQIQPRGGWTDVVILDQDGNEITSGWAACCEIDNYNKKLGVKIALGRAIKQAQLDLDNYLSQIGKC